MRAGGRCCDPGRVLGSGGNRLPWERLPREVHEAVAALLGSPVVRALPQPGGFSPGSADRVVTAAGHRAFVKAVSPAQNEESPRLQAREARISAALPPGLPVPRFLGATTAGEWEVLVLADVDGRHPALPWRAQELRLVLDALADVERRATPCPVPDLPSAAESLAGELPAGALALLEGDCLVHLDLRADNVLLTPASAPRAAVLVDWPHACRGPAWLDVLLLLVEVERVGGRPLAEGVLATHPSTRGVDPDVLTTVLDGFAGFFLDRAREPAPPGLPSVRAFQRLQGEALREWVLARG